MSEHGKPDSAPYAKSTDAYQPTGNKGAVFPGKPYLQDTGNLAVQRSLMEIFDEFTDVISGELKSMRPEDFEEAYRLERQQAKRPE